MKTTIIYHRADFDGLFCREIARTMFPDTELLGWDYGDPEPFIPDDVQLYMLDIHVPSLMNRPNLIWIDHHKSAMDKWSPSIHGYRIDGVAACRLAWQWFNNDHQESNPGMNIGLPTKQEFTERKVSEPLAVRLAGEYDIWDKRDPSAELFQHGLRSRELTPALWDLLLSNRSEEGVDNLLESGRTIQYAQTRQNESVINEIGFTFQWEGLTFLACNAARYNSHLFTAGLKPEHDACFGFKWTGKEWSVSLYGVPGKPDVDLAAIAVKYGGGGHKQACGFRCADLPFLRRPQNYDISLATQ